jgi:hypothetical protein
MKVLYNASELRTAVREVFSVRGRRVALVAFVGDGAETYLPNPKGLELVCCPDGRSTNPKELRRLMAKGVDVRFSDNLHVKVYWSRLGAVVASANLSDNGLGGGLKELGVLLGPGQVDITHALRIAKPRKVTDAEMRRLDHEYATAPKRKPSEPGVRRKKTSFGEWLRQPHRQEWKLGWWDTVKAESKATRMACLRIYKVKEIEDYIDCNQGNYREGDWILTFRVGVRSTANPDWLVAERVFKVPKSDPNYDPDYGYEAVQVYPLRKYGEPPFDCNTKRFLDAFHAAAIEYGLERIGDLKSVRVPAKLLNLIVKHYGLAAADAVGEMRDSHLLGPAAKSGDTAGDS